MISEHQEMFYVGGEWVAPRHRATMEVENPATTEAIGSISLASRADVDAAVNAAAGAFESFSVTTTEQRIAWLEAVLAVYERRRDEFARAMTAEMGGPISLTSTAQCDLGSAHLRCTIDALRRISFEALRGNTLVVREPTGVAALITPWNWPVNQVFTKFASAFAAGCTMVLKPSEVAPLNAVLFAEVVDEAGIPPGVFNLINGEGPTTGAALVSHPRVDVVSFTGSTRAGVQIAKDAAATVKVVHQELGGKSPNVILDDIDLELAVPRGVLACYANAGQSCSVATRMLVPAAAMADAAAIAKTAAEDHVVGDPTSPDTTMGPLVNRMQFEHVQGLIQSGIDAGATLVCGGTGRPEGLDRGYFVKPTVFADVDNSMEIAQTEIFGPVLSIIGYEDKEHAISIANDSIYGLAAVVQSSSTDRALRVARRLVAGHVYINHEFTQYASSPFGGRKQSGNGYEHDEWGLAGFLSTKAILGSVEE
ncbi:MAG: aldehyde dehydrogenase family protein [Acidimicrobiales bacterium]